MTKRFAMLLAACALLLAATSFARKPMTVDAIQTQLLAQPWSVEDQEPEEERRARSRTMATSLYDAVKKVNPKVSHRWVVAAVITIWWQETRFSRTVHEGGLTRWGSDEGRAKCFGQLHEQAVGLTLEEGETLGDFRRRQYAHWQSLVGTDSEATTRCAVATMELLLVKFRNCAGQEEWADRWLGAFGDYGSGGRSCTPGPTSEKRLDRMKRIAARL